MDDIFVAFSDIGTKDLFKWDLPKEVDEFVDLMKELKLDEDLIDDIRDLLAKVAFEYVSVGFKQGFKFAYRFDVDVLKCFYYGVKIQIDTSCGVDDILNLLPKLSDENLKSVSLLFDSLKSECGFIGFEFGFRFAYSVGCEVETLLAISWILRI